MLLALQFPICDARGFLTGGSSRLDIPDWPAPRADYFPQFVRHFGPGTRRRLGGNRAWSDEETFCSARRALRFVALGRPHSPGSERVTPSVAFRRLFFDGQAAARVEVGLRVFPEADGAGVVVRAVQEAMSLPTEVLATAPPQTSRPLVAQGLALARLYARATTRSAQPVDDGVVEAGVPLVVIERRGLSESSSGAPSEARRVDPAAVFDADLHFAWVRTEFGPIATWFLSAGGATRENLRQLRLILLRLHAEQQALDLVLKLLRRGRLPYEPGTEAGDDLELYLNEMTRGLDRPRSCGAGQREILTAVAAAVAVVDRDPAPLLTRLDGARRQIRQKLERYERERSGIRTVNTVYVNEGGTLTMDQQNISGGTFHGPVVGKLVADRIDRSFNTINQISSPPLKEALTRLHDEVKEVAAEMGETKQGDPEILTAALETFAEQAAKDKPLGEILRGAGKELVEAAKAISDRATPVLSAVNSVLKIVGVAALVI